MTYLFLEQDVCTCRLFWRFRPNVAVFNSLHSSIEFFVFDLSWFDLGSFVFNHVFRLFSIAIV